MDPPHLFFFGCRHVPGVLAAALLVGGAVCFHVVHCGAGPALRLADHSSFSADGTVIAGVNLWLMYRAMPVFADWPDQFANLVRSI